MIHAKIYQEPSSGRWCWYLTASSRAERTFLDRQSGNPMTTFYTQGSAKRQEKAEKQARNARDMARRGRQLEQEDFQAQLDAAVLP